MEAEQEAIRFRAPHGQGTTDTRFPAKTVATAATTSTAEQDTGWTGNISGQWVTFAFTSACYVRFGETGIGAATASDFYVPGGCIVSWWITATERYFRVYGTAVGSVSWYLSA